jgi:hypothetical protein
MKSLALILTRKTNDYVDTLKSSLDIDANIISDSDYEDNFILKNGFYNLTATVKKPSAWDKSFFLLSKLDLIREYDYVYFIEDDVFSRNNKQINNLISTLDNIDASFISHDIKSKQDSLNWYWWRENNLRSLGSGFFDNNFKSDNLYKSFNPFCRLSSQLLKLILHFRTQHHKFYFHEILFPTLCIQNNMKTFDLSIDDVSKNFFDIFRHRPVLDQLYISTDKIYHPLKPDYPSDSLIKDGA